MDIINASGMRFSRKLRFRTAEIGFYLADDFCRICRGHQPFCWNENILLRENGGNFYAYITGTDFFAGTSYGSNLPEDSPATHYWNVVYGNYSGTICAEPVGCIDFEYFITAATDRADHYTSQGRIISGSEGFEKSRTFRSHAVLRSRYL